jgi:hypothetical protein
MAVSRFLVWKLKIYKDYRHFSSLIFPNEDQGSF